tara:strand:+ start:2407 stop:3264 length:858 start_codon:yes stop_codon:yes gene_type:complete
LQIKDFFDLVKIRILFSALLTTFFGYSVALEYRLWNVVDLSWLLIGSCFVFSASAILNHVLEIDTDSLMERTKFRPLPTKRVTVFNALVLVGVFMLLGLLILFFKTNWFVFLNSIGIFVLYNFVYTPLKRLSILNTFVGAFPGAMPLLSGWFMVQGSLTMFVGLLFLMLYFWQLPHFFSISWIYKESYEAAQLNMVSVGDSTGIRTRFYLGVSSVLFIILVYLPLFYGYLGGIYIVAVTILNIFLMVYIYKFSLDLNDMIARKILLITVFYPLIIPLAYVLGILL